MALITKSNTNIHDSITIPLSAHIESLNIRYEFFKLVLDTNNKDMIAKYAVTEWRLTYLKEKIDRLESIQDSKSD